MTCYYARIPCKDPSKESLILPPAEFERITALSRVLTKEEKEARAHQRKKEEEMVGNMEKLWSKWSCRLAITTKLSLFFFNIHLIQKAVEEAKRRIFNADLLRKENKVLTQLELEARDREQRLLEQANALRMEQEEEVKLLNSVGNSSGHVENYSEPVNRWLLSFNGCH